MASMKIVAVALAILGNAVSNTLATDYVVGDDSGWTLGYNYEAWANGKNFRVGDKIIFKFSPEDHSVVKVDQIAFQSCVVPRGAEVLGGGNIVFELKAPGTYFWICGTPDHCEGGNMKVSSIVLA